MSEVSDLKEKIRKLENQLRSCKRAKKKLEEDNRTLYASFKESIRHIDEALSGKTVQEVIDDLKDEGEL